MYLVMYIQHEVYCQLILLSVLKKHLLLINFINSSHIAILEVFTYPMTDSLIMNMNEYIKYTENLLCLLNKLFIYSIIQTNDCFVKFDCQLFIILCVNIK